jgi:hypothetical protein
LKNETLGRTNNIIFYTFQPLASEEDIQEAFSADGTTVFKKSFSIELVKESAGIDENDNDILSLTSSLFVSFMMAADLVV